MADTEKQTLAKVVTLIAAQRELLEKFNALAKEIEDVLGGKASIGTKLKEIQASWKATHSLRYPGEYVWVHAKDNALAKRLVASLSVEEIKRRMLTYVQNDDAFYARARHNFGLFVGSINLHAGPAAGLSADLELDNDVQATKRKMAETRGPR